MGTSALIGLGSNLGDRKSLLDFAVAALSNTPGLAVQAVSSYHETEPVGGPGGQGSFLNAAVACETTLEPRSLLDRLQAIEHDAGRIRTIRWGDRTLDLDLLIHGNTVIDTAELRVPHPRMALRRFVLAPLSEIAPNAVDPVTGRRIRDLLANLDRRPSYVAFATMPPTIPREPHPPSREENRLYHELVRLMSEMPIERPVNEKSTRAERETETREELRFARLSKVTPVEILVRRLNTNRWSPEEWGNRWLVSSFWFDALFLWCSRYETSSEASARDLAWWLEARSQVVAPTFVVARPSDVQELHLQKPNLSWRDPIGRDTPVLVVEDFTSQAALDELLAACAATRAG